MQCALERNALFQRLSHVRALSFQAWSNDHAWRRQGNGRVTIERLVNGLIVKETGVWRQIDKPKKRYQFSNSWLYQCRQDYVVISHLRFGYHQPVELCRLIEQQAGLWVAINPHYCGQDCYSMSLDARSCEQIICDWLISGNKAEQKHIVYLG